MRLTRKFRNIYVYNFDKDCDFEERKERSIETHNKIIDKCGQLEDVLEEFEIDDLEDLRDRLTKYKFLANHELSCVDTRDYNLMLEFWEKCHSIEEELGINLIILLKILKQKFVYNNRKVKIELVGLHIRSNELCICGFVENTTDAVYLRFKNYGKTWSLTKEELL